jgi:hypothetical protein
MVIHRQIRRLQLKELLRLLQEQQNQVHLHLLQKDE